MDAAIAILVIATVLGIIYVSCIKDENRDLKEYLEFYRKQLKVTLASLESGDEFLQEVADDYRELCERYCELFEAYKRAYEILEKNGLLPEDDE